MILLDSINTKNLLNDKFITDLPEFYNLKKVIENSDWHNESVFSHTIKLLLFYEEILSNKLDNDFLYQIVKKNLFQRKDGILKKDLFKLVILFHDIGKKSTIIFNRSGTSQCPGHEKAGYIKTNIILNRFDLSISGRQYILKMIKYHGIFHVILDNIKEAEFLIKEKSKDFIDIYHDLLLFCLLDTIGSHLKINNLNNFNDRIYIYKKLLMLSK